MIRATVNDDSMQTTLVASVILHIVLLLFIYFGLPVLMKPISEPHPPVPFEIVTLAELTNTRVDKPEEPKPPAPPPKPEMKREPPPPVQQPTPQEVKQPPAPPKPPEPVKQEAEAIKPKIEDKPKPIEKPKPPQPDPLASILKNVAKLKPVDTPKPQDTKPEIKQTQQQPAATQAPTLSDKLTVTEQDAMEEAIRERLRPYWSPPIGARDAQNIVVEATFDLTIDGIVQNPTIVDSGRMMTDSFFRASAEAVLRALRNPNFTLKGAPQFPADKYEHWKHVSMLFNPRDMF